MVRFIQKVRSLLLGKQILSELACPPCPQHVLVDHHWFCLALQLHQIHLLSCPFEAPQNSTELTTLIRQSLELLDPNLDLDYRGILEVALELFLAHLLGRLISRLFQCWWNHLIHYTGFDWFGNRLCNRLENRLRNRLGNDYLLQLLDWDFLWRLLNRLLVVRIRVEHVKGLLSLAFSLGNGLTLNRIMLRYWIDVMGRFLLWIGLVVGLRKALVVVLLESLVELIVVVDVCDVFNGLPGSLSLGIAFPPDEQVLLPLLLLEVQDVPDAIFLLPRLLPSHQLQSTTRRNNANGDHIYKWKADISVKDDFWINSWIYRKYLKGSLMANQSNQPTLLSNLSEGKEEGKTSEK